MKKWLSANEMAALELPGMPGTKRGIHRRAERENWKTARQNGKQLSRPRKGRGGGVEYHYTVMPIQAQRAFEDLQDEREAARTKRWRFRLFGWQMIVTAARIVGVRR